MKAQARYQMLKFNKEAYRAALHTYFVAQITEAAHLWLQAITAHIIPVWSGASMKTFAALASSVGFSLPAIVPAASFQKTSRLPASGQGRGGLITAGDAGKYFFTYESQLPHLVYNEYRDANAEKDPTVFYRLRRPGPYHFQAAGQTVFRFFAEHVRLPNPFDHLKTKAL